jgi:putative Holliday junction resolvase
VARRTLAIDFGTRRIGLALSDEGGRLATPHDVLEVTSPQQAIEPIAKLVAREGVQRIVIGLPLNMDGTLGPKARETLTWSIALEKSLTNASKKTVPVPVLLVDERLSSFEAEQQVIERKRSGEKITRKAKKQQLDALAAARFLQDFLDGKLQPIDPNSLAP